MRIHPSSFTFTLLLAVCSAATLVAFAPSDFWADPEPSVGAPRERSNPENSNP